MANLPRSIQNIILPVMSKETAASLAVSSTDLSLSSFSWRSSVFRPHGVCCFQVSLHLAERFS
jgi:hypothetical protein